MGQQTLGLGCCESTGTNVEGQYMNDIKTQYKDSTIVLYWHEISMPSRAIKALLVAGNVLFLEEIVNPFNGDLKRPEILHLNPSGTIPFITVDG